MNFKVVFPFYFKDTNLDFEIDESVDNDNLGDFDRIFKTSKMLKNLLASFKDTNLQSVENEHLGEFDSILKLRKTFKVWRMNILTNFIVS